MPKVHISFFDIFTYVGDRSRAIKEGEALFNAGHIVLCGVNHEGQVKSLCLQTSALTSPPHEILIDLSSEKWICLCSCKAGNSGYCKHIVGTLIYYRFRNEDLELISCTDVTQSWGKEKKAIAEKYGNTEVQAFCHNPKGKCSTPIRHSTRVNQLNLELLVNYSQKSAIGKFFERTENNENLSRNLKTCDTGPKKWDCMIDNMRKSKFLGNIAINLKPMQPCCQDVLNSLFDTEIVKNMAQGSDEWKKARQLRITGSRCYAVFTYSKTDEWTQKAFTYFWPKGFTVKATEYGKRYEAEALQCFRNVSKHEVATPPFIVCERFPWLGYSPDGVILEHENPVALLEIKCPFSGKDNPAETFADSCDYLQVKDDKIELKKRHQYYGQVQMGMALLNVPMAYFILYSPYSKSFLQINVKFDEHFTQDLLITISNNYFNHMLHVYCENKNK